MLVVATSSKTESEPFFSWAVTDRRNPPGRWSGTLLTQGLMHCPVSIGEPRPHRLSSRSLPIEQRRLEYRVRRNHTDDRRPRHRTLVVGDFASDRLDTVLPVIRVFLLPKTQDGLTFVSLMCGRNCRYAGRKGFGSSPSWADAVFESSLFIEMNWDNAPFLMEAMRETLPSF